MPPVAKSPSSEFLALRRAVERDRYGLMAYVLMARDHCTPQACPAFRALADSRQIATNMDDRVYENMITRYASSWNSPAGAGRGGRAGGGVAVVHAHGQAHQRGISDRGFDARGQHHGAGAASRSGRGQAAGGSGCRRHRRHARRRRRRLRLPRSRRRRSDRLARRRFRSRRPRRRRRRPRTNDRLQS